LAAQGVRVRAADILSLDALLDALSGCDAAIHVATAIPRPGGGQDWSNNDQVRREGTVRLLEACRIRGVARYVQQSIAMLVPSSAAQWVDESGAVCPNDATQSAADMEKAVRASALDWRIVRGGAFYGVGTGREEFLFRCATSGELSFPIDPTRFITLVHVADYAEALIAALEHGASNLLVNAVDDEPVTYGELYRAVASAIGVPPPESRLVNLPSYRASNAQARLKLGWRPFYASYRSGLLPLLQAERDRHSV
jgi:nucleoside-diphosphate-sugar epimerase